MRNDTVHSWAQMWVDWSKSKRQYVHPSPLNALITLQPSTKPLYVEDNDRLSMELTAFNQALGNIDEKRLLVFLRVYLDLPDNIKRQYSIKRMTSTLNINRSTFYRWSDKVADEIQKSTNKLIDMYEQMQREKNANQSRK